MAEPFLARMGVDWGPAITGTRQFIAQIETELQKLNRLGPAERTRALATGQAAVQAQIQGAVGRDDAGQFTRVTGGITPRDAARLTAQSDAVFASYARERNEAVVQETVARRLDAQRIRQQAAQELEGNAAYQTVQAELLASRIRQAAAAKQSATLELEGSEAYLVSRAETLAAQQRINAEVRARAATINGSGPGGGSGGGILGLLGGGGLLGSLGQGALLGAGLQVASQVRQAVEEALQLNQQLSLLRDQATAIGQSQGFPQLRQQIIDTSRETGVAVTNVATLASEFLGLYQDAGLASVATNDAAKILRVIGGDAKVAGPAIAALAEDLNVSVQDIGNAVVDLQDKTGRTGADMLAALGQVAPVAAELNLSLDQTRGLIEAVGVGSSKTGQQLGDLLSRVLPQLEEKLPKLAALGIDFSARAKSGDAAAALRDILTQVTSQNQDEVTAALGGPRGAQVFAAVLKNRQRALQEFDSSLTDHNLLNDRAAAAEDNLQGSLQRFHQELVSLGDAFAKSGAVKGFQDLIDLGSGLVDGLAKDITYLGKFNDALDGIPARIAEVALALKGLTLLAGIAGVGGAAGGGGGILAGLGLGGLAGRATVGAGASGVGAVGADGLLAAGSSGVGATGIGGAVAALNPATLIPIITVVAAAWALQTGEQVNATAAKKRADLLQQFDTESTQQLQDEFGKNVGGTKGTSAYDLYNNSFSFGSHSKTPTKAVDADKIRQQVLQQRYTNAGQEQMQAMGAAAQAATQTRTAIAMQVEKDTGGVLTDVSAMSEILQAYQEGAITVTQAITASQDFIKQVDSGYPVGTPGYVQNAKDVAQLAKFKADQLKTNVQNQIDDATASGRLSDALSVSIYTQALKDPSAGDPSVNPELRRQQAAALHKQFTDTIAADQALRIAGAAGDPFAAAAAAQQNAGDNLDILAQQGKGPGSPEYKDALAKKLDADRAVVDAQNQINAAKIDLLKAQDAADPLQVARDNQRAAAQAVDAAHGDAEKLRAQAQQFTADRGVEDAIAKIADARLELLKAVQTAGGDTVGAARTSVNEIQGQIDRLVSRGATDDNSDALVNLRKDLVSAQAGEVSARIQSIETGVDQDLQLRTITVRQAVDRLQAAESIATSDQQRKDIEIKIKQLLDSTGQNLAFNIPQGVQVPTLYQVRRFEATRGVGVGYNDNRNLSVTMFITNGMDEAKAKQFVGDLFGVSASVVGATARSY